MNPSLPHDAYNELADSYAAMVETKAHNAFYDRPAVQSLVPQPLKDCQILDAGCGPGVYSRWLLEQGAAVCALDVNERMLDHARRVLGDRVRYVQANLEEPLEMLEDAAFDGIVSPLTVTYCRDLRRVFAEFARVLKPGGWLVFSTEHPFFVYRLHELDNYYATQRVEYPWKGFGKQVVVPSYHHSLSTITNALSDNGMRIERIIEPLPVEEFREQNPESYEKLLKFPLFIFFRARKP